MMNGSTTILPAGTPFTNMQGLVNLMNGNIKTAVYEARLCQEVGFAEYRRRNMCI